MKDIKQYIIIGLLVIVIIGMAVIYSGQKAFENRMEAQFNTLQSTVYSATAGLSGELSEQVRQALLSDKFLVADVSTDFPKEILRGEEIEGNIHFTLTESKDIEKLYVVIEDYGNNAIKVEAEDLGNLRYSAHVKFDDANNYKYYVMGVTTEGEEVMLNYKSYIDISSLVYERAYLYMESAGTSSDSMHYKGNLSVHQNFEIEKVDMEFVKVDEYSADYMDNAEVKKTIDVTEYLVDMEWSDFEQADIYYYDYNFALYNFYKIDINYTAEDGEDLLYDEYIEYRFVVTFTDGSTVILY